MIQKKSIMRQLLPIFCIIFFSFDIFSQSYKTITSDLELRSGPSSSYEILLIIPNGSIVQIDEDCECEWLKVNYNGDVGYLNSKYLLSNEEFDNQDSRGVEDDRHAASSIKFYTNSSGQRVQSPTFFKTIPKGASALCRDGTYSFSKNRRGTCSHHGGVSKWLRKF